MLYWIPSAHFIIAAQQSGFHSDNLTNFFSYKRFFMSIKSSHKSRSTTPTLWLWAAITTSTLWSTSHSREHLVYFTTFQTICTAHVHTHTEITHTLPDTLAADWASDFGSNQSPVYNQSSDCRPFIGLQRLFKTKALFFFYVFQLKYYRIFFKETLMILTQAMKLGCSPPHSSEYIFSNLCSLQQLPQSPMI